jgi:hypothetical protein
MTALETHKPTTKELKTMGTHRKSAKRNRALTVGAVAIGIGALAAVTAPAAQADWFGLLNGPLGGNGSGNDTLRGNGNDNGNNNYNNNNQYLGGVHGNGNTNQSTWASGNSINNQLGLGIFNPVIGGISANLGATAGTGGFSTAIALPITVGNGSNVALTAGLNPATSISANVGAGLALGVGGFNIGAQAPIAAPVNIGLAGAASVAICGLCDAGAAVDNGDGDATALTGNQTNGTLNQATQTQTTGATDVDANNTQTSTSTANSNGNITVTNQISGNTNVTAGATSSTGGSGNARTITNGVAGQNVAQSPSRTNDTTDAGSNSTNHTGNGGSNNNTNGGGNTTNDN